MELPLDPHEWTLELVERLVSLPGGENQDFEFKGSGVMEGGSGADTLSKAASAFANSRGGHIIIGVRDQPRAIQGVRIGPETTKHVADKLQLEPRPDMPAPQVIGLANGLGVVVVTVPAGHDGPYASVAGGVPRFYVRTHSGSEPMTWTAIRDGMVRADERRRQGQLLLDQLAQHFMTARMLLDGARERHDFPVTVTFDLTLTHLALAAVHPWLSKDVQASTDTARLLSRMNTINGQVKAMIASVAARPARLDAWRGRIATIMSGFRDQVVQAEAGIRRVLDFEQPDYRQKYPEW